MIVGLIRRKHNSHWSISQNTLPGALAFLQGPTRLLRRRHRTVTDHTLGELDGGVLIDMGGVGMLAVCKATALCALDAPRLAPGRPLDLGPQLTVDCQMISVPGDQPDLDSAIAAPVGTMVGFPAVFSPYAPPTPFSTVTT
jgi:hypothetical protein